MPARTVIRRAGRPSATLARDVALRGHGGTLAILVEVWGAGQRQAEIEQRLASGIASAFGRASGSTTARLRTALEVADHWLRALAQAAEGSALPGLGAGASVLLLDEAEAILAQVGPAVAFGLAEDGTPRRFPAASPWLRRGVEELTDDPLWPPLGLGARTEVHWHRWPVSAGVSVLLAASTIAEALTREVVAPLLAGEVDPSAVTGPVGPPAEATPLLLVMRAAPPAGDVRRRTSDRPDARARMAAIAAGRASLWARSEPVLRAAGARAVRAMARVLVSLLPARAGPGAGGYALERTRLLGAAAIALPLAIVALTLFMQARYARLEAADGFSIDEGPPSGAPEADRWSPVDDVAGRVERLADIVPMVGLDGKARDDRSLVAVGGVAYVLNRASDRVDRVSGPVVQTVLERGRSVGEDVVAELEDLFWLPAPGAAAGGAVVALDAAGRLWRLADDAVGRVPVSEQPVWRAVSRAEGFDGNLYVVDRSAGQIVQYRHDGSTRPSFPTPGAGWLAQPAAFAAAVDLAIDGAIYVLLGDGSIQKFQSGSAAPFALAGLPEPLDQPRALYTSPTASRLLLADSGNGRIVVLSSEGAFQGQLLRPPLELSSDPAERTGRFLYLQDLWWDEAAGMLYVVAGNVLYRAAYR